MTEKELIALHLTKDLWKAFVVLPVQHPDDLTEFRIHIHAIQNMILAREGSRVLNSTVTVKT
jgi:hypothetical protein